MRLSVMLMKNLMMMISFIVITVYYNQTLLCSYYSNLNSFGFDWQHN